MELTPTAHGQPIELRFALIFGFAPLTRDQPLVLQPVQRWVQRSLLNLQLLAGDLLDAKQNPVAMHRADHDRAPLHCHVKASNLKLQVRCD